MREAFQEANKRTRLGLAGKEDDPECGEERPAGAEDKGRRVSHDKETNLNFRNEF